MFSGGALPTPLNTEYMGELTEPYDKIKQYAFHKRYQIHLVEYLEKTYINKSFNLQYASRWLDTPGLKQECHHFISLLAICYESQKMGLTPLIG